MAAAIPGADLVVLRDTSHIATVAFHQIPKHFDVQVARSESHLCCGSAGTYPILVIWSRGRCPRTTF